MKIKYTARVRRGLETMRCLLIDAADDSKPPVSAMLKKLKKAQQDDFNQAMAWLEQECAEDQGQDAQVGGVTTSVTKDGDLGGHTGPGSGPDAGHP